ncbi:MAG TPA: TetR family transcriptional regulator [Solirubrobacteraceae bacterium]|nr:TetR family transcriptional regulator [Solirubrobacteraceae bacterium]
MAPPTRTPRAAWIDAGLRALGGGGGPDAVRVDVLAKSLGVTRGGFYGRFKDRGALLDAMLDAWEQAATDEVLEQVERRGGDARAKIRRAGALTFSDELLPIDLAIRDWARHDSAVAARLRRVDNRRMDYLRELFGSFCDDEAEIEGRAVLAFSLAIGYHFIAADRGARNRRDALELAVRQLLA